MTLLNRGVSTEYSPQIERDYTPHPDSFAYTQQLGASFRALSCISIRFPSTEGSRSAIGLVHVSQGRP